MRLTLPYPVTVNHYWWHRGHSKVITDRGRAFRADVLAAVWSQGKPQTIQGDIAVTVKLYPPDNRLRDIDNSAKSLLDALQHAGVFANDYQVSRLTLERCEVRKPGGAAEVVVEVLA